MTIHEVSQRIGKSESTIRRMIKVGTITASKVNGKYDISDGSLDAYATHTQDDQADKAVNALIDQLKEKDKQIEHLEMIVMQMTKHLEALQPPPRRSFWDRLMRR